MSEEPKKRLITLNISVFNPVVQTGEQVAPPAGFRGRTGSPQIQVEVRGRGGAVISDADTVTQSASNTNTKIIFTYLRMWQLTFQTRGFYNSAGPRV